MRRAEYQGGVENFSVGDTNNPIKYDRNGNIRSLYSYGMKTWNNGNPTYGLMDKLVYTYTYGNQLRRVVDHIPDHSEVESEFKDGPTGTQMDYTYDKNANMIKDANKGISSILYNHLNLPTKVR